jgi:phosphoribosylaminoimidazole-succinocarboxamide synthase
MEMKNMKEQALAITNNFSIKTKDQVHSGKVRSVYWLTEQDSRRLIQKGYLKNGNDIWHHNQLGVMITSDKISAFDCNWKARDGLDAVPGKGAALNQISEYWFNILDENLVGNHLVESPHPLVWIVQKAKPILVEAIMRDYITGSMWRAYSEKGIKEFCGITLPDGLKKNQILESSLFTPSTKGTLRGISGVPEKEDTNISFEQIKNNYPKFGFNSLPEVDAIKRYSENAMQIISHDLRLKGELFVDTKFEYGIIKLNDGMQYIVMIDEVGTPDSSRMWNFAEYTSGKIVENSKEGFRQFLLKKSGIEEDILLNSDRFDERKQTASEYRVPRAVFFEVSETYKNIARKITGKTVPEINNPREEIMDALAKYKILK